MHILLTGGTGLIGRALCQLWLRQGHQLTVWSRRPERVAALCGNGVRGIARLEELADAPLDAVINLAGAPIADRPWTNKRKALLWDSRVALTERLLAWLEARPQRPRVLISGSALITLAPFFIVICLLIRRDGGNAFFAHYRVGKDGKLFGCMKFRSMISNSQEVLKTLLENDAEARMEWERDQKLKNDPRITPVGNFLRKTSLDELPQLINVLRGDMSLVGPRPVTQEELSRYGEEVTFYLRVKPGITGLWQVSGRNDTTYETRVALDTWYVQNWSVYNDLVILFKTIKVVIGRDGSY